MIPRIFLALLFTALVLGAGVRQMMAAPFLLCDGMPCAHHQTVDDHGLHATGDEEVKDATCEFECDLTCAIAVLSEHARFHGDLWCDTLWPQVGEFLRNAGRTTPDRPPILI